MKLKLKTIIVFFIIFVLFLFSHVYAIDLFLANTASQDNTNENITENDDYEFYDNEVTSLTDDNTVSYSNNNVEEETFLDVSDSNTSTPSITTTVASDNSLTVSDIINIILIAVCIVLIFLAIAILIRCK